MTYDLAIVGSGFGGSLLAMVARRLGLTVVLIERGEHPRFAIGESTSPLTNLILEQLALRYDLPRLLPLATYGTWRRAYPEIGVGLKRGFTFFDHRPDEAYRVSEDRANQLLVAANPHDEVADTHWLRSDVDQHFMREAVAAGAEYFDHVELEPRLGAESGIHRLTGVRNGEPVAFGARFVVDATGPRGFLSRALRVPETSFDDYPATQALFTHFSGVRRCDAMAEYAATETPPYPIDDAAVHHLLGGQGWMWVLRFGNGVTSAGVAVTDRFAAVIGLAEGEPAWRRLMTTFPTIARQFERAETIRPFTYSARVAYRASRAVGDGWAMLPSAVSFVDPLFSTGIPLTLLGIERLGRIFGESWGAPDMTPQLAEYEQATLAEADAVADLVGACYAAMPRFEEFAAMSMFYFAAASYSEMDRRLNEPRRIERFLAANHPEFNSAMRACGHKLRSGHTTGFDASVRRGIDCINIAGLSDPAKRNWYGVDLRDVVAGAHKLGFTPAMMRAILRSADWARPNDL